MTTINERIEAAATIENAKKWRDTPEQFTFALDLLDLSLSFHGESVCKRAVDKLEDAFERLLEQ